MLLWAKKSELVDLVGFAKMCRYDLVPFFDMTSKHSNVRYYSSVVVKIGIKDQCFEWVMDNCRRPEGTWEKNCSDIALSPKY